mmetsp:Transcript_25227/g.47682  ORF Transcript_25227/g.47682 Transcript_25227/m.47682 type:complete len:524 (+) Transcript_25227:115-1686(+)
MSLFGHLFGNVSSSDASSLFNPAFLSVDAKGHEAEPGTASAHEQSTAAAKRADKKSTNKRNKSKSEGTLSEQDRQKGDSTDLDDRQKKSKKIDDPTQHIEDTGKVAKKRKKPHADSVALERELELEDEEETTKSKSKAKSPGKKSKAAEAGVVRDDQSKQMRTIFVGNLAGDTTRKALKKLFSKFGSVESARLRSVPVNSGEEVKGTRRSKCIKGELAEDADHTNAYVVFATEEEANAALAMNMQVVAGRHVRVDHAARPTAYNAKDVEYERTLSVFIGNLAFNTTEEDVIRLFHGAASTYDELADSVEAVRLVRDRDTNKGKGIGFVLFKTRQAARAALNLNTHTLKEREIRVMRVSANGVGFVASKSKGSKSPGAKSPGGKHRPGSNKGREGGNYTASPHKGSKGGIKPPHSFMSKDSIKRNASKKPGGSDDSWRGTKSSKTSSKDMLKKLGPKKTGIVKKDARGGPRPEGVSSISKISPGVGLGKGAGGKPGLTRAKGKRPSVAARKAQDNKRRDMMRHT